MAKQVGKEKIGKDLGKREVRTTIEIKPIVVQCNGMNHERIRWKFDPYEVFEIVKNVAAKTESELAIMLGAPEGAIKSAVRIINRKYRAKNNVILTWKAVGYSKTSESYMRNHRAGQVFEKINSKGDTFLDKKTLITFGEVKDMTPQIKTEVITEENIRHNHFKLQEIGDAGSDVME